MSSSSILIKNARIFDGHNEELSGPSSVLLEGGMIREIAEGGLEESADLVIDAESRTLMPGLIDNHIHVTIPTLDMTALSRMPDSYIAQYANIFLNATLMRGFTSIRDIGGGDIGIARAIEHDMVRAPRFFYSGKIMSQTGGHGDFRPGWEVDPSEQLCSCGSYSTKLVTIVDDPFQMRRAVRDELRKGSHCIKIMGSGGVASPNDPLHHTQFTEEEIRAAVDECTRQETYVAAHCHPAGAVRRCVEFGVRSIEHGTLIDRETADYVAEQGAFEQAVDFESAVRAELKSSWKRRNRGPLVGRQPADPNELLRVRLARQSGEECFIFNAQKLGENSHTFRCFSMLEQVVLITLLNGAF